MTPLVLIIVAYLVGAVPFGLLIGLARGVDIRQHGSKNIGATNTGRVLGRKWGIICLILDMLKGALPALAARFILLDETTVDRNGLPDPTVFAQWLAVGLAAVLGHVFPIYLGFRGGKGVATTIGCGLGVFPYLTIPMIISLIFYFIVRKALHMVSAGSLALAVAFPISFFVCAMLAGWDMARVWPLQITTALLAVIIIVRHASNIRRIARGEELRTT